jgi:hypothetical protein
MEVEAGSLDGGVRDGSQESQQQAADPSNEDITDEEKDANTTQRLAAAKHKFAKKNSAHFPPARGYDAGMQFRLLDEFQQGAIFERIKLGKVSVAKKASKSKKFQFRREWYQPLAWFLDNPSWSSSYFPGDNAPERRKTSVSFVELACLADTLTGGAIGPRRGTFEEKAAIMKEGIAQLMKKASVTDANGANPMAAERFLYTLPNVCSASPLGFPALPGMSRRPILAKFPGAHAAIGALLNYARAEEDVLASVMPRYFWFKPIWQADSLLSTWEHIMALRAGKEPQRDVIVPNLQPLQLQPVEPKKEVDKNNTANPAPATSMATAAAAGAIGVPKTKRRRVARQGSCTFGCMESTERKQGRQIWRCVPSPSPWSSVAAGSTI